MTNNERLTQMLEQHRGILPTAKVVEAGIPKPVFYAFARENGLERLAHGVYADKNAWPDAMYLLHLRFGQAVFSHETALFFHGLTDREPSPYTVTVKTGYNPTTLKAEGVLVYTIHENLYSVGLTTAETPFGQTVPTYDMERTICDILRSRSRVDPQTLRTALREYTRRKDKNLRTLTQYAAQFHMEKLLRQYLEVLL